MKASSPSIIVLGSLFLASSALAKPAGHHPDKARRHHPHTTAMHTTQVHSKDASTPGHADAVALPELLRKKAPEHAHDAHEGAAPGASAGASSAASTKKKAGEHGHAPAAHHKGHAKKKAIKPKPPCLRDPITLTRGIEEDRFSLTKCDGAPAPLAVEHISMLARPGSMLRPATSLVDLAKKHGPFLAPGIKRVDSGLAMRLQEVVDHFAAKGKAVRLHLISGYRPQSVGSYHASAQAMDFNMEGVTNEALVTFCKTLTDTGCGYYPNSSFIHMDVRAPGTGHVAWIDASGPGERPHYVASWPPPPEPKPTELSARLARLLPGVPVDDHPAEAGATAAEVPPPPAPPAIAEQGDPGDTEEHTL